MLNSVSKVVAVAAIAVGAACAPLALADVLLIEEVRSSKNMELPKTGQLKSAVEAKFGRPESVRGPVGDPPITRWVYDEFSVYFEYDHVITAVLHHGAVLNTSQDDDS